MLDKNQIENMKQQVIEHIQKNFPEEKKQNAIEQILSMDDEEFIELLKENNIIHSEENKETDCIFCSIIFGDTPSVKIGESDKAIAVLEINPISEGHTLIIPKNHLSFQKEIDKKIEELTVMTKEKLENALKPKEIKIFVSEISGHSIINIVPIYSDETMNSKRKRATQEELLEIKKKIESADQKRVDKMTEIREVSQDERPPKKEFEEEKLEIYDGWIPKRVP